MTKQYPDPSSKSSAKTKRREIFHRLKSEHQLTFAEIRQVWRIKKHIPYFHFRGVLVDFRGAK